MSSGAVPKIGHNIRDVGAILGQNSNRLEIPTRRTGSTYGLGQLLVLANYGWQTETARDTLVEVREHWTFT